MKLSRFLVLIFFTFRKYTTGFYSRELQYGSDAISGIDDGGIGSDDYAAATDYGTEEKTDDVSKDTGYGEDQPTQTIQAPHKQNFPKIASTKNLKKIVSVIKSLHKLTKNPKPIKKPIKKPLKKPIKKTTKKPLKKTTKKPLKKPTKKPTKQTYLRG